MPAPTWASSPGCIPAPKHLSPSIMNFAGAVLSAASAIHTSAATCASMASTRRYSLVDGEAAPQALTYWLYENLPMCLQPKW